MSRSDNSTPAPTSATLTRWCVSIDTLGAVHVTVEARSKEEAIALARADLAGPWEHAVEDPPTVDWPTVRAAPA